MDKKGRTKQRKERTNKQIPVVATFSAPVQKGPGAHSASYAMGTESVSQG